MDSVIGYTKPNQELSNPTLEKVLRVILGFAGPATNYKCLWAANTTLAKEIRVSTRTVSRYITRLEEAGAIRTCQHYAVDALRIFKNQYGWDLSEHLDDKRQGQHKLRFIVLVCDHEVWQGDFSSISAATTRRSPHHADERRNPETGRYDSAGFDFDEYIHSRQPSGHDDGKVNALEPSGHETLTPCQTLPKAVNAFEPSGHGVYLEGSSVEEGEQLSLTPSSLLRSQADWRRLKIESLSLEGLKGGSEPGDNHLLAEIEEIKESLEPRDKYLLEEIETLKEESDPQSGSQWQADAYHFHVPVLSEEARDRYYNGMLSPEEVSFLESQHESKLEAILSLKREPSPDASETKDGSLASEAKRKPGNPTPAVLGSALSQNSWRAKRGSAIQGSPVPGSASAVEGVTHRGSWFQQYQRSIDRLDREREQRNRRIEEQTKSTEVGEFLVTIHCKGNK